MVFNLKYAPEGRARVCRLYRAQMFNSWIAIVAIGLGNEAPMWVGMALILIATILSLAVHVLYAVTFSTAPVVMAYQGARRWIQGSTGLFFSFAAYKIATYRQ